MSDEMTIPSSMSLVAERVEFRTARGEDGKATREFTMTAYTGAPVHDPFVGQIIVDLGGLSVRDSRMPILLSHDFGAPAGFADRKDIRKGKDGLFIDGKIIERFPAGGTIVAGAENDFAWQASIGFQIGKAQFIEDGESAEVNGRKFKGPGIVISKSTLIETSFVPAGADGSTTATVFARANGASCDITVERNTTMSDTDKNKGQMSAEDIDKAKAAAADEAAKAQRAQLAALKAAFPDRIAFAVEQFEKGHTVEQAKAALSGVLATELSAANAKVGELEAKNKDLQGKLDSFEDGSAGAKTTASGASDKSGAYDGNWGAKMSDHELAKEHWSKNFDNCKTQFGDDDRGFNAYAAFVTEERRILSSR